jgi:hypothetical protein
MKIIRTLSIILLTFIYTNLFGQNNELYSIQLNALNYFRDSIYPTLTKHPVIKYDGSYYKQKLDSAALILLLDDYHTMDIQFNDYDSATWVLNEQIWLSNKANYKQIVIDNNSDSTIYYKEIFEVKKPLKYKKKLVFKMAIIPWYLRLKYKRKLYLQLHYPIKINNEFWITISLNRPNLEYGEYYIIRIDKSGKILDYEKLSWIQ